MDPLAVSTDAPPVRVARRAVLMILGATLCFATLDSLIKYLSQLYPVSLLVWARWTVQALVLLVWLAPQVGTGLLRTDNLTAQLFRGAILLASSLCFMSALKVLPLAEATALNYSTPALVTIMAVVFLDERMTPMRVAFVVLGPARHAADRATRVGAVPGRRAVRDRLGVVLRDVPGRHAQARPRGLADAHVLPVVGRHARALARSCRSSTGPTRSAGSTSRSSSSAGLIGTLGHYLFLRAFQLASASAITPFTYMQLVWATLIGWVAFGSFPDFLTLVGMARHRRQRPAHHAARAPQGTRSATIAAPTAVD